MMDISSEHSPPWLVPMPPRLENAVVLSDKTAAYL
jgi:hypothetical protein